MSEVSVADQFWFLNTWVTVRIAESEGRDQLSILEHRAPYGDSPPLHIHHTEDEVFHVLEGHFLFVIDGKEHHLGPGEFLLAPRGVPHQYLVESPEGGHWLTITTPGDFERFVRVTSRPADRQELPAPSGPPSEEVARNLTETAAEYGIEIIGPPLHV
ncbi:MAG: cupin domain-containing protein [Ignavibacteriae bacterium]|nr:cupin domain-containing protein [Ignavibacteriota bacterium]